MIKSPVQNHIVGRTQSADYRAPPIAADSAAIGGAFCFLPLGSTLLGFSYLVLTN